MTNILKLSPIDSVTEVLSTLTLPPSQARALRLAMLKYAKDFELSHEQMRKHPAHRKVWDSLLMACMSSLQEAKLASVKPHGGFDGLLIDANGGERL